MDDFIHRIRTTKSLFLTNGDALTDADLFEIIEEEVSRFEKNNDDVLRYCLLRRDLTEEWGFPLPGSNEVSAIKRAIQLLKARQPQEQGV